MPLVQGAGREAISENIRREKDAGRPRKQAVAIALDVARKQRRASGGAVTTGPLQGDLPGRTDHRNIAVPKGSYVLPADIVSGLGEGNTFAGTKVLDDMFKAGPYGMKMPKAKKASGYKKGPMRPYRPRFHFADGGGLEIPFSGQSLSEEGQNPEQPENAPEGVPEPQPFDPAAMAEEDAEPVDIVAADGEYIVPPEKVAELGDGDMAHGHAILDAFVKQIRGQTIDALAGLPGPATE